MHTFLHTLFPLYSVICMAVSECILCEAAPYQFQQFLDLACGKEGGKKKIKKKISNTLILQVTKYGLERKFKKGEFVLFHN